MLVNIVHVWAYSLQGFPAFLTVAQEAPNVTQVSTWHLLRKLPFGSSDTCLGVLIKATQSLEGSSSGVTSITNCLCFQVAATLGRLSSMERARTL